MAEYLETDLVVLGGGPGGYAAAFLAADRGMRVTLVDTSARPGGACLHLGCIPWKALLHVAEVINSVRDATSFGVKFGKPEIDLEALRAKEAKIVDTLSRSLLEMCKRRNVTFVNGRGKLTNPETVQV